MPNNVPEDNRFKITPWRCLDSLTLKKIKESYKTILNESCNLKGEGGNGWGGWPADARRSDSGCEQGGHEKCHPGIRSSCAQSRSWKRVNLLLTLYWLNWKKKPRIYIYSNHTFIHFKSSTLQYFLNVVFAFLILFLFFLRL